MSALAQPSYPLSVRTHHRFRKIRSFLHQKVRTSASEEPLFPHVRTGQSPYILSADVFYGQSLIIHHKIVLSRLKHLEQSGPVLDDITQTANLSSWLKIPPLINYNHLGRLKWLLTKLWKLLNSFLTVAGRMRIIPVSITKARERWTTNKMKPMVTREYTRAVFHDVGWIAIFIWTCNSVIKSWKRKTSSWNNKHLNCAFAKHSLNVGLCYTVGWLRLPGSFM